MWKSFALIFISIPLSFLIAIGFWASGGFKAAVVAGCSTIAVCVVAATVMLFFRRSFSLGDVFLPAMFSVIWSLILIPFSFGADLFSAPAAIGSGLVLTLCLWRVYHNPEIGKNWLILPIIVYIYEMLPINLPGPFDDYFAFGGEVVYGILFYSVTSFQKQLPPSSHSQISSRQ